MVVCLRYLDEVSVAYYVLRKADGRFAWLMADGR